MAVLGIPLLVARQLLLPVTAVGRRDPAPTLASMLMPEAPINEDDLPARWKDHVRATREVMDVKPVAKAKPMNEASND